MYHKINSSKPIVSVVTPSLNQGVFIEDAITSVLGQGIEDFEHWIIDGGSSDNTMAVLKKYPHLKVIAEPDEGQSDALNKGFRHAQAEWVVWLNADDYLLPSALHKLLQIAQQNSDCYKVIGNWYMVDKDQNFLRAHRPSHNLPFLMPYHYSGHSTGALFRKTLFTEHALWLDKQLRIAMDTHLWARMGLKKLPIAKVDAFVFAFRYHGENVSKKKLNLDGAELATRMRKHYAERDYIIRQHIFPSLRHLTLQRMIWKTIRFFVIQRYRILRLLDGTHHLQSMDNKKLAGSKILPASYKTIKPIVF